MSSLAWIDFDAAARERTDRLLEFFKETDTRDELGLGGIRDGIADHLFPGTSTIQTRLRYMLFVPWLFRALRAGTGTRAQTVARMRDLEFKLSRALLEGGERTGVIGRESGIDLKRPPSSIYWAGLGAWGIRRFEGSLDAMLTALRTSGTHAPAPQEGEEVTAAATSSVFWHPALPAPPKGLLESIDFKLTADEAQFLLDRLMDQQKPALLTFLSKRRMRADCEFIWLHPNLADFAPQTRRLIEHARKFSIVFYGAALLYNLLLARLIGNEESVQTYQGEIATWRSGLAMVEIANWNLNDFFESTRHLAHQVHPAAEKFVREWVDSTIDCRGAIETSKRASEIVRAREEKLKKSLSRFTNSSMRDRWSGASGTRQFEFRWRQAASHISDLIDAE